MNAVAFSVDGRGVEVPDDGGSLLDALREHLGCRSAKDGCSPQGQCGCCTVWVDGAPRVSCVTPVRRVAGRQVTTVDGLPENVRRRWAQAFVRVGASQCGFCTPGIVMRLAALDPESGGSPRDGGRRRPDEAAVRRALVAHLCRCTGWQTIVEAACDTLCAESADRSTSLSPGDEPWAGRDPLLAAWRAQLEGPEFQASDEATVLGKAGFADDTSPAEALVAVEGNEGSMVVAPTLAEARRRSAKVQGRNSTVPLSHPLTVPEGDWALTLRTTWVEPAYLEPDASWCVPGGVPATPLANGGAFGGKRRSPVPGDARRLADDEGRAVRVLWSREAVVRRGPKRPPVAIGIREDGSGVLRLARVEGPSASEPSYPSGDGGGLAVLTERVAAAAPGLAVEEMAVTGPPTSADLRGAGWAEAAVAMTALGALREGRVGPGVPVEVQGLSGGRAQVTIESGGEVSVEVWAGEILDPVVLRSYCIGAVHQALGWVWTEGVAVDADGEVRDLTIRSFGILPARDTPPVRVVLHPSDLWPVNGSDAVFAATAAAAWRADGLPSEWPTRRGRAADPHAAGSAGRRSAGGPPT